MSSLISANWDRYWPGKLSNTNIEICYLQFKPSNLNCPFFTQILPVIITAQLKTLPYTSWQVINIYKC